MKPDWSRYEETARKVLSDLRQVLRLTKVKGKQSLQGLSGTDWEVDAKAWREGPDGFVVIEVRRQTSSGLKQEAIAAVAYRVHDVGGVGGIVVSPLPLQKGAKVVATHAKIEHVCLSTESTTERYMAEFMDRCYYGASVVESANATDASSVVLGWKEERGA